MLFDRPTLLLCAPRFFKVTYEINPWMKGNINRVRLDQAMVQWDKLRQTLSRLVSLRQVDPVEGLPDMVFTANAGVVSGKKFVPSRFAHPERQGEEAHFKNWFATHGFEVVELEQGISFEGAGDALFDRELPIMWGGYGFRTDLHAHEQMEEILDVEVVALRLVDERFYHLDTCLCPLGEGHLLYYPSAFDEPSQRIIERLVPPEKRLPVSDRDAFSFACNAVSVGKNIVMNQSSVELTNRLSDVGYTVHQVVMSEFLMAGGSVKCLTLRLDDAPVDDEESVETEAVADASASAERKAALQEVAANKAISARRILVLGHLLDSGIFSRMLDSISEAGGSWEIERFEPGRRTTDKTLAQLRISAPSSQQLDDILDHVVEQGALVVPVGDDQAAAARAMAAMVASKEAVASRPMGGGPAFGRTPSQAVLEAVGAPKSAAMIAVEMDGVAPDDFAITTIYPTEVCIDGRWIRVAHQRMDACIVVTRGDRGLALANCVLLRDLKVGDKVVCGSEGIRIVQKRRAAADAGDFKFMGSGVSSERRVEVAVEQISWDMDRIREQGGRTVVVAGPVVVHTGGAPYLAELIREGYVAALLGGNAVAVHDIEQNMYGTSLGVDMQRGVPVTGGHKHHIKTINSVRRAGGIAKAVESGMITKGILYECVRHGVPFSLAGSIRDDGPLPETRMDLIEAQREYQRMIEGADLILMLSSMLHSIGVGNMTPAGVKLICVDINPAVVTKLADRGSQESVGIVTDVGLFLRLLTDKLREERQADLEIEAATPSEDLGHS